MASIPTVIYIGGTGLVGPSGGVTPQPGLPLTAGLPLTQGDLITAAIGDPELLEDIGSNATYQPWWDGTSGIPSENGADANGQFLADTGTTTTSLVLDGGTFGTDDLVGVEVYIDVASGAASQGNTGVTVTANTATTLTLSGPVAGLQAGDVVHLGQGAWRRYRIIRGEDEADVPSKLGTNGDNWFNDLGNVGPSARLMHRLDEQYASGERFRCLKFASANDMSEWTGSGGTAWDLFEAVYDDAFSAAKFGASDTPDFKAVIVDLSREDTSAKDISYAVHLSAFLVSLRAKLGTSTVPILLVSPPRDFDPTELSPVDGVSPWSNTLRFVNRQASALDSHVRVVDLNGYTLTSSSDSLTLLSSLEHGNQLGNLVEAVNRDAVVTAPGTGIATYIMIGDSQCVGTTNYSVAVDNDAESILGPAGSTIKESEWVYNSSTGSFELYDVTNNDNANPNNGSSFFGPSASFLRKLKQKHPEGVVLLKVAEGGASMTIEGQTEVGIGTFDPAASDGLWDNLKTWWAEMQSRSYDQLTRVLDLQGIGLLLGDNDLTSSDAAAAFAAKIGTFIDQLEETFQTRVDDTLDIAWLVPPKHVDNGGQTSRGTSADRETVRNAIISQAASRANMTAIDDSTLELKRESGNPIHWTTESTFKIGDLLSQALLDLASGEGATSTTSSVSGAATFNVETGSGASDSNAYCEVSFADSYHEQYGNPSAWSSASDAEKKDTIRQATRAADERYGSRWRGDRGSASQALDWPRAYVTDPTGYGFYDSDEVPTALQQWTARAALLILNGYTIEPETQTGATIKSETKRSAGGFEKSTTYLGGKGPTTEYPALDRMLEGASLIEPAGPGWGWSDA